MYPYGVGSTNVITYVKLRDATTGFEKTGLAYNSAGAFASYTRPKQAAVSVPLASQTPTGDWVSGGFCEVDSAIAPGLYRFDLPNGASAIGADFVLPTLGFSGVLAETVLVLLDPYPDVVSALVVDDPNNTATTFKTNLPSATDNFYKSLWFTFRTGALGGQAKQAASYNGSTHFLTMSEPYTGTPAANDQIVVVNR